MLFLGQEALVGGFTFNYCHYGSSQFAVIMLPLSKQVGSNDYGFIKGFGATHIFLARYQMHNVIKRCWFVHLLKKLTAF